MASRQVFWGLFTYRVIVPNLCTVMAFKSMSCCTKENTDEQKKLASKKIDSHRYL
jgi:hypothetical protein